MVIGERNEAHWTFLVSRKAAISRISSTINIPVIFSREEAAAPICSPCCCDRRGDVIHPSHPPQPHRHTSAPSSLPFSTNLNSCDLSLPICIWTSYCFCPPLKLTEEASWWFSAEDLGPPFKKIVGRSQDHFSVFFGGGGFSLVFQINHIYVSDKEDSGFYFTILKETEQWGYH